MERLLQEAQEIVEELRHLDDGELIDDDIVGCAANASDRLTVIFS